MDIKEKNKINWWTQRVFIHERDPDSPQCGFSMTVSNILKHLKVEFNGINVLRMKT